MDLGWRSLSDAEREREYSPSSCIGGDYMPYLRAHADRSEAARRAHPPRTLRYGPGEWQTIDLFMPSTVARPSVLVFFHGGYWQELSKRESALAAPQCLAHGIAYAAVDYTLAPKATLSAIVDECRTAVACLSEVGPLVVAGSSAGAHLAAMVANERLKGAVLVSGIYELEPLIGTSINAALRLDVTEAARNSPMRRSVAGFPPSLICWGDNETDQFRRQSQAFARMLHAASAECSVFECPGRNHFDVILDLADPATELGRRTLDLLQ